MTAGLYLHIPFCIRKCGYCDFFSVNFDESLMKRFVGAVFGEIELRADEWKDAVFSTIYFGGGTPSLLDPRDIAWLLDTASRHPAMHPVEVTLECNPGTISMEGLCRFREAGINRLSIGVQSFDNSVLSFLGRIHDADAARGAFEAARNAGLANVGIDLIYGIPGQTPESWASTINETISLGPDHVSMYELTVEDGTPISGLVHGNKVAMPDDASAISMYESAVAMLESAGIHRYEISNFARTGHECMHNLNYWRRGSYLGVGPSAHSFRESTRRYNLPELGAYLTALEQRQLPPENAESLSVETARFERVMLALRTSAGIPRHDLPHVYTGIIGEMLGDGLLVEAGGRIALTKRGVMLSNEVFMRLMP
jgi:oxygen-independent coproporphyrinogen-3 oxidase